MGLIVLPYAQTATSIGGIWDVICGAAGVPKKGNRRQPGFACIQDLRSYFDLDNAQSFQPGGGPTRSNFWPSNVQGVTVPSGVSSTDFPNLAGQYAAVIYKELRDFKSGARVSDVMAPLRSRCPKQDMVGLAAYYSSLPRLACLPPRATDAGTWW